MGRVYILFLRASWVGSGGVFVWMCEWDSSTLRLLVGSQSELVLFIRGDGYRSVYVPCLMRSGTYLFRPVCCLFSVLIVLFVVSIYFA